MVELARGLAQERCRSRRWRTSSACSTRRSRGTRTSSRAGSSPTRSRRPCSANAYERARELVARGAAFPHPSRRLEASVAYGRLLLAPDAEADALRRGRAGGVRGAARAARSGAARPRRLPAPAPAGGRGARVAARRARHVRGARHGDVRRAGAERAAGRGRGRARRPTSTRACCSRRRSCRSRGWRRTACRNRDIGQALYLSHRTIGSHLYRIFPKLGVASRGELRALLAQ